MDKDVVVVDDASEEEEDFGFGKFIEEDGEAKIYEKLSLPDF